MTIIKPDFFVVGSQKAGTTTLHEWLVQSNEVALPWTKETHFFCEDENYSWGLQWYADQFKNISSKTKVFGEVDPEYMYFAECAERIKSLVESPKLIIVLRDPLARAYSHYQMSVRRGYEPLSFNEALFAENKRLSSGDRFAQVHHSYIDRGLYFKQLERLFAEFNTSEILVLLFEDLYSTQESAERSLKRICDFIGISSDNLSVDIGLRENQATMPRFIFLRDFIYRRNSIKTFLGKMISSRETKIKIIKILENLNNEPLANKKSAKKEIREPIPLFVYEDFIDDLQKVQALSKVDVSHWIKNYEEKLRI